MLNCFPWWKKTQTKIHTAASTRLFKTGDFSVKSESRAKGCKKRPFIFLLLKFSTFFPLCGRSCNRVSGWGLKTSGFTPICNTDAFDKSLFVCILGSYSAEGGWAVNLAAFLSWTWTPWEMTVSHYELYITWHQTAFSLLFTRNCTPARSNSSQTSRWSKQKSHASQPKLYLQPPELGSSLALATNSLLIED